MVQVGKVTLPDKPTQIHTHCLSHGIIHSHVCTLNPFGAACHAMSCTGCGLPAGGSDVLPCLPLRRLWQQQALAGHQRGRQQPPPGHL